MARKKTAPRPTAAPTTFDQARDELFSHILRCGVLEAAPEHQREWMDDTMQYIADRYTELTDEERGQVRVLGERFCQPVVRRVPVVAAAPAPTFESGSDTAEADAEAETVDATH